MEVLVAVEFEHLLYGFHCHEHRVRTPQMAFEGPVLGRHLCKYQRRSLS